MPDAPGWPKSVLLAAMLPAHGSRCRRRRCAPRASRDGASLLLVAFFARSNWPCKSLIWAFRVARLGLPGAPGKSGLYLSLRDGQLRFCIVEPRLKGQHPDRVGSAVGAAHYGIGSEKRGIQRLGAGLLRSHFLSQCRNSRIRVLKLLDGGLFFQIHVGQVVRLFKVRQLFCAAISMACFDFPARNWRLCSESRMSFWALSFFHRTNAWATAFASATACFRS